MTEGDTIRAESKLVSGRSERRRYPRVTLQPPLVGSAGRAAVIVLDASTGGLRVAHHSKLPAPGDVCRVEIPSGRGVAVFECLVVRTIAQPTSLAPKKKDLFQSGLEIVFADERSRRRLEQVL